MLAGNNLYIVIVTIYGKLIYFIISQDIAKLPYDN